ncbi:hypothetical protein CS8_071620 [Cupriavidus sp. 8B]
MPRTKRLQEEMTKFLEDSGYDDPNDVCVVTDGALDLAGVADDLPFDAEWVLDWAHIGRMLRHVDQAITPLAYGRLTAHGSAFVDPNSSREAKQARCKLIDLISYLNSHLESLIDYRSRQRVGLRIATGFVESSINRINGRRMCKSQHMRWSRLGAHSVLQVRVALLNQEFHELIQRAFPWIAQRRVSWPWQRPSRAI